MKIRLFDEARFLTHHTVQRQSKGQKDVFFIWILIMFISVVAAHFADFKVSQARIVKADQTRLMHVSYRMQDQVYWTANKVQIPEGETLITDGDETARARCGNRVSAVPVEPISEEEPIIEVFDFPRMAIAFHLPFNEYG